MESNQNNPQYYKVLVDGKEGRITKQKFEDNLDALIQRNPDGKVWVNNPDGQSGKIPMRQYRKALEKGYTPFFIDELPLPSQPSQESAQPQQTGPQPEQFSDYTKGNNIANIAHNLPGEQGQSMAQTIRQAVSQTEEAIAKTPKLPWQTDLEYTEKVAAESSKIQQRQQAEQAEYERQMAIPQTIEEIDMQIAQLDGQLQEYDQQSMVIPTRAGDTAPNFGRLFNPNRKELSADQIAQREKLNEQKQALRMQRMFLDKIQQYQQYDKNNDRSRMNKLFEGMSINGDMAAFATFGLSQLYNDQQFIKILDKVDKGLDLTVDENKALILYQNMQQLASKNRGAWFNAGSGFQKTFEFMRDMALGGIGGGFKAIASQGLKETVKTLSKQFAKKALDIAWKTPLLPGFRTTLSENVINNYNLQNYGTDQKPQWNVDKLDSDGKLIYKTWAQNYSEYLTESMGAVFENIGIVSRIARSSGKAGAILNKAIKQYDRIHDATLHNSVGRFLSQGFENIGLQNIPAEFMEEIINVPLQSLMMWDSKPLEQLANPAFYQEVGISTAALGGIVGAANMTIGGATAAIEKNKHSKALKQSLEAVNQIINSTDDDAKKAYLADLVNDLDSRNFYNEKGEFDGKKILSDLTKVSQYVTDAKDRASVQQLVKEALYKEGQTQALKAIMEDEYGSMEYGTSGDVWIGQDKDRNELFILGETADTYLVNDPKTKQQRFISKSDMIEDSFVIAPLYDIAGNYFINQAMPKNLETIEQVTQAEADIQQQAERPNPIQRGDKVDYSGELVTVEDVYTDGKGNSTAIVIDSNDQTHNVPLSDLIKMDLSDKERYLLPDGRRSVLYAYDNGMVLLDVLDDNNNVVERVQVPLDEFGTYDELTSEDAAAIESTPQQSVEPAQTQPNVEQPQTETLQQQPEVQTEAVQPAQSEVQIPLDKDGNTDFDALLETSPELFAQEYSKIVGPEETLTQLSEVASELDKQIKKKSNAAKKQTSFNKKAQMFSEISALKNRREALVSQIMKMTQPQAQIQNTVEGQTNAKGENVISKKWQDSQKVEGNTDVRTLPDGSQLKGRWVLAEADAATPSHNPHTLQPSEGFPTTAQGKNINDNDYTKKSAEVRIMAADYDGRAIDNPIFVKDGIVVSGNNRTMSGILAAENGTDSKYLQSLQQRAQALGFTQQQIDSFNHPRVFFEVEDDIPMTTEMFAKFNQRETKSKTPTERAIVASKRDNSRLVSLILSEIDKYEKLSDVYQNQNATAAIVRYMVETGLINNNEVAELYENGFFTANGKDFLESLLIGTVIGEDQIKILNTEGMKSFRGKIVKSIIPLIENTKLRQENQITGDLNQAILYLYQAKASSLSLDEYVRQNDMFERRLFDEDAVFVAIKLQQNEREFRSFVEQVNARLSVETPNMFTGQLENKQDIYGEFEQQLTESERAALNSARETNAQTKALSSDGAGAITTRKELDGVLEESQPEDEIKLSELRDNEGNRFFEKNGSVDIWDLTSLLAKAGRQIAPVRLTDRNLSNILQSHNKEFKNNPRFVIRFIDNVLNNAKILRKARAGAMFVIVENDKTDKAVIIRLYPSVYGDYYNVETAGYYRKSKWNEEDIIAELSEPILSGTATDASKPQTFTKGGEKLLNAEAAITSEDKVNEPSSDIQQKSEQTVLETAQNNALNQQIDQQAKQTDTNPTQAQKEAGNYKMGHVKVQGLNISIENPAGSIRSGVDQDGKPWSVTMNNHYGYIRGTKGKDKDHIDVFLGENLLSDKVYVVDQVNEDGAFDEHKVMIGFDSVDDAKAAYLSNYSEGWQGLGNITEVPMSEFKMWISNGTRKIKPFTEYKAYSLDAIKQQAEQYSQKYGTPVEVMESADQIKHPLARRAAEQGGLYGWYDIKTSKVFVYAPNILGRPDELEKTVLHEVVAHKGLRSLLGDAAFDKVCDAVWDMMSETDKIRYISYIKNIPTNMVDLNQIGQGLKDKREAADEYMASIAEDGITNPSVWEKIKRIILDALREVGINIPLTDADIAYMLYRSSKALQKNTTLMEQAAATKSIEAVEQSLSNPQTASQKGFDQPLRRREVDNQYWDTFNRAKDIVGATGNGTSVYQQGQTEDGQKYVIRLSTHPANMSNFRSINPNADFILSLVITDNFDRSRQRQEPIDNDKDTFQVIINPDSLQSDIDWRMFEKGIKDFKQSGDLSMYLDSGVRFRNIKSINDKFNEDLQKQIDGVLPKGYIYSLGMPSEVLLTAGLPNLPIELAASRLSDKSMQENHPFELSEMMGLVNAIQNPIAVFRSATHLGSYVVLTEIQHKGKNYVVAIKTNKNKGRIRINDIRSVHYRKSNSHIANWIIEGLHEYVDKQKMLEWLSKQQYNSAEVRNLFKRATKVVNDFENPTNIRLRYKTSQGKNVNFTQLSLFDQAQQSEQDPLLDKRLRPLQEGEFCHVERIFTQSKAFDFTSGEQIKSSDDVAYIFSQLENESIENAFAVLVKNGKPYVIHVGMGGFDASYFNIGAIVAADKLINADEIYMVHNHPSGALEASNADVQVYNRFVAAFGNRAKEGIIINLTSGRYGVFTDTTSSERDKTTVESQVPIKLYSFNKQVFDYDFDPKQLFSVTGSSSVASFISSQRLGDRAKINILVLNRQNKVVGNILTEHKTVDMFGWQMDQLANQIVDYTIKMGGSSAIVYGSGVEMDQDMRNNLATISKKVKAFSGYTVEVLDWIYVSGKAMNYMSTMDEGIRFRVTPKEESDFITAIESKKYQQAQNIMDAVADRAMPDSKVRDENGKLIRVTHYSFNRFTEFNPEKIGSATDWGVFGKGFYFSNKDHTLYGNIRYEGYLNIVNPIVLNGADDAFKYKQDVGKYSGVEYYQIGKKETDAYTEYLKSQGYDGVIYNDVFGNNEYVAFYPNQFKLADTVEMETYDDAGNIIPLSKRFDINKRDIRFRTRPISDDEWQTYQQRLDEVDAQISQADGLVSQDLIDERGRIFYDVLRRLTSEPFFIVSQIDFREIMEDAGVDQDVIDKVEQKYDNPQDGTPALYTEGQIFFLVENISSIEDLRLALVHERQHGITYQNWDYYYNEIVNRVSDTEELRSAVSNISFGNYETADLSTLVDEFPSFAMMHVYSNANYPQRLQQLGVNDRLIDFVKQLDYGQKQNNDYINSRRGIETGSLGNDINMGSDRQDVRDQSEGSTEMDQQRAGSIPSSQGGTQGAEGEESINQTEDKIRFRYSPIFQSNAERATLAIKQNKATAEQWLAMLQKNGGLKTGEDKWIGLSDWLKQQQGSVTKDQVLDYIRQNQIQVEEVWYSDEVNQADLDLDNEVLSLWRQASGNNYDKADWVEKKLAEKYGSEFSDAATIWYDGSIRVKNQSLLSKLIGSETRPINSARLDYTTQGLKNNKEVALVVPSAEPWGKSDETHFGDTGDGRAIAWVRFGQTFSPKEVPYVKSADNLKPPYKNVNKNDVYAVADTKNDFIVHKSIGGGIMKYIPQVNNRLIGNTVDTAAFDTLEQAQSALNTFYKEHPLKRIMSDKILVIDEIQSKRHQEGRERGYRVADINKWLKDNNVEVVESGEFYEFVKNGETDRRFSKGLLNYDIEKAKRLYVSGYQKSDIPDAPFGKNWHELALKRMLRYAAENNYDVLAWTKGEQQAERYNLGSTVDKIESDDNVVEEFEDGTPVAKDITIWLKEGPYNRFSVDANGNIRGGVYGGHKLSDVVGKELVVKLMKPGYVSLDGNGLTFGGEGMKGFYDKMLVDYMNKYGKKWGVKVEDIDLPSIDQTMHSIKVTDAMKESVLSEPQLLFRKVVDQMIMPQQIISDGLIKTLGQQRFDNMISDIYSDIPLLEKAADVKRGVSKQQAVAALVDKVCNNIDDNQVLFQQIIMAVKDALNNTGVVMMPDSDDLMVELWKATNLPQALTIKERLANGAAIRDIRLRVEKKAPPQTNQVKLSRMELWRERLLDRMISVNIFYNELKKLGIKISDDTDPYVTENLAMSRSQTEDAQFKKEIYQPLIEQVIEVENLFIELGLAKDREDAYKKVNNLLYARHAPERNKNICVEEVMEKALRKISAEQMSLFKDSDVRGVMTALISRMYNEKSSPSTPVTSDTFAKNMLLARGADKKQQDQLNSFRGKFAGIVKDAKEDISNIFASERGTNRSGMTDQEAKDIMAMYYTQDTKQAVDKLSDWVRQSTHFTVDTWYKYSLIDDKTRDNIKKMYRYYIPLRSWEEKEDVDYDNLTNQAFNKASEIINLNHKASGRTSRADDPLVYIASLAQSAIVIGNKNMIRLNLYRLIKSNQNVKGLDQYATLPKLYYVETPGSDVVIAYDERPAQELFDQNLVKTKTNKSYKWHKSGAEYDAHIVPVMLNGTRQMIELRGELGVKVASAINNTNVLHWQAADALKPITNWLSAVRTSYNPEFILTNFARDFMFSNLVYPTEGGSAKELNKNLKQAFKSIHRLTKGKPVNSKWDAYYKEFLQEGGQTGFFAMRNIDQMRKEIEKMHKQLQSGKMSRHAIAETLKGLAEYSNNMSESAMRLAVFITEREKGTSVKQAAYKAHEISVNFNRKGTWSGNFGGFYSFFNASMQGTSRLFTWVGQNKQKSLKALAAITFVKLATNIIAALVGGDDYDELSDYVKFSNIVIPIGTDSNDRTVFFCLPMAQGIRAVTNLADNVVDCLTGNKSVAEATKTQIVNTVGEFLPLSFDAIDLTGRNTSYSIASAFTPTVVQPWMDIWVNMDFKGDPIYKEPFLGSQKGFTPEYKNVYGNTNPVLVGVSRYLNNMAGGSNERTSAIWKNKKGEVSKSPFGYMFDINPARTEHLLNAYLGGLMSFPSNVIKTAWAAFDSDTDVQLYNFPVVNRFAKKPYQKDGYQTYYQIRDYVEMTKNTISAAKKEGDFEGAAVIQSRNIRLLEMFEAYDDRVKQLRGLLKSNDLSVQSRLKVEKDLDEIVNQAANQLQKILDDEKNTGN